MFLGIGLASKELEFFASLTEKSGQTVEALISLSVSTKQESFTSVKVARHNFD